ncbi:hypothetical protein SO694_00021418 [Aureococcus anophagefferens]|uniref:Uncharacterized protein n=1 Tax=Aureococcus anophagefferens TaxID=44056 RepID=A0ABR1FU57_AURAN
MFTVARAARLARVEGRGAVLELYAARFEAKHGARCPRACSRSTATPSTPPRPSRGRRGRRGRRRRGRGPLAPRGARAARGAARARRDEEALVALAAARAAPARAGDASDAALDAARGDRLEALGRLAEAAAAGGGAAAPLGGAARAAQAAAPRAPERRAAPSFPATARGLARAAAFLDEHGYAASGQRRRQECEAILGMLWDWLEGLGTGLDRGDAATWVDGRWPLAAGAFDGPVLFRPGAPTCAHWWHVDQHPARRPGREPLRRGATRRPRAPHRVLTANHGDFAATPAAVKRRYATPPPPALTPLDRRYVGYDDDAVKAM